MPPNPLLPGVLQPPALPEWGSPLPVQQALGERSILEEDTSTRPHPAATERAEKIFEITGLFLILVIALAAAWVLIKGRL
ncbi:hypothetical protein MHY87_08675 [Microvirga sp. ACRRW]|uniref:hypothetical protein n=1 Tax=Microvirga sp. ACRRW TaxID=2918205 RepID=UPI001EF6D8A4|nr:hypothetical protein [Microvirga sp. ACRRW]MCG7392975.1 hypothetical protein [Microvirga sp. ACRRW]